MFNHMYNAAAPFALTGQANTLPAGSFYTGAIALAVPSGLRYTHVQYDPPRNYVLQWNINVQRQLTPDATALISYVGSRGVHQLFMCDDVDIVLPTLSPLMLSGTRSGSWSRPLIRPTPT
jgi:hypothetical protein